MERKENTEDVVRRRKRKKKGGGRGGGGLFNLDRKAWMGVGQPCSSYLVSRLGFLKSSYMSKLP